MEWRFLLSVMSIINVRYDLSYPHPLGCGNFFNWVYNKRVESP